MAAMTAGQSVEHWAAQKAAMTVAQSVEHWAVQKAEPSAEKMVGSTVVA